MRNRITIAMAAVSALALITGVAWAAMPSASPIVANEHLIDVSDAGQVVVAQSGAELEIVGVETNPGWTHEVEVAKGREVEADFRSPDRRIQFNAELEDGQIRVRVRERTGSTVVEHTSTTVAVAPSTTVADSSSTTAAGSGSSTTMDDITSTSIDDSTTSTTVDDSTSTTMDDTTSTTMDDTTSTSMEDSTTSTTVDDSTSTTMGDAPTGSGSETYAVGGAASVTVSWANGTMSLGSVSVSDGWVIEKKEVRSDRVKLEFENGESDAEFEARLESGSIRVEIDVD